MAGAGQTLAQLDARERRLGRLEGPLDLAKAILKRAREDHVPPTISVYDFNHWNWFVQFYGLLKPANRVTAWSIGLQNNDAPSVDAKIDEIIRICGTLLDDYPNIPATAVEEDSDTYVAKRILRFLDNGKVSLISRLLKVFIPVVLCQTLPFSRNRGRGPLFCWLILAPCHLHGEPLLVTSNVRLCRLSGLRQSNSESSQRIGQHGLRKKATRTVSAWGLLGCHLACLCTSLSMPLE